VFLFTSELVFKAQQISELESGLDWVGAVAGHWAVEEVVSFQVKTDCCFESFY